MRILTVRNPWAWAIIHGGKDVENRVRNIAGDYRGPLAIHAGKGAGSYAEYAAACRRVAELKDPVPFGLIFGHIIGVVDLVDVHEASSQNCWHDGMQLMCSPWAEPDVHHLVLDNPRPLVGPIPFTGALGLRRLDAGTTRRIEEQLA